MCLHKVMLLIASAIEEADQVLDTTGGAKKEYVLQAVRSLVASSMDNDDANLINALAPHVVDLVIAASRGQLAVNVREARRRPRPRPRSRPR